MVFDLSLSVMPLVYPTHPPKKTKKKKSEVYNLTVRSALPISLSNVRPSVVVVFFNLQPRNHFAKAVYWHDAISSDSVCKIDGVRNLFCR